MLNPSNTSPEQQYPPHPLKLLIQKHPFAFWGGLWVVLIGVGSVATLGLLNPGPIAQDTPKPTPAPASVPIVTPPKEDFAFNPSLSVFGAIAIGCATGSVLFTYVLLNSSHSHGSSRRLRSVATISKKRRHSPKKRHPVARTTHPVAAQPVVQTLDVRLTTFNHQMTQVTVLSPDEIHPLDRGEESLAELLDLRKRQSLASLMHGKP